jgi:hypothetical protein
MITNKVGDVILKIPIYVLVIIENIFRCPVCSRKSDCYDQTIINESYAI